MGICRVFGFRVQGEFYGDKIQGVCRGIYIHMHICR